MKVTSASLIASSWPTTRLATISWTRANRSAPCSIVRVMSLRAGGRVRAERPRARRGCRRRRVAGPLGGREERGARDRVFDAVERRGDAAKLARGDSLRESAADRVTVGADRRIRAGHELEKCDVVQALGAAGSASAPPNAAQESRDDRARGADAL